MWEMLGVFACGAAVGFGLAPPGAKILRAVWGALRPEPFYPRWIDNDGEEHWATLVGGARVVLDDGTRCVVMVYQGEFMFGRANPLNGYTIYTPPPKNPATLWRRIKKINGRPVNPDGIRR